LIPGFNISPEDLLHTAVQAVRKGQAGFLAILDRFHLPIYVTDAGGVITYHNRACIDFAGRTPVLGEDSWCVSWKLYTLAGEPLPHDQCPMAVSLREGRPIRGAGAIAECPLGTRTMFMAYPTPLLDERGSVLAAGNILVPKTGGDRIAPSS
jgi:PAS domain-containing protein